MASAQKVRISKDVSPYPMPTMLLGSRLDGKANFMAASWLTRVNVHPPMMGVALYARHFTARAITESGCFSLNLPGEELLEKLDYCGLFSGHKVDKASIFTVIDGQETQAPMIEECPMNIELRLERTIELPSNLLFIGEVCGAYCAENCLLEGRPDIRRMHPVTLSVPDNNYWSAGSFLGPAWNLGRKYRGDVSFPLHHKEETNG